MHFSLEQTAAFSMEMADRKKGLDIFGPPTPHFPFLLALKRVIVVGRGLQAAFTHQNNSFLSLT